MKKLLLAVLVLVGGLVAACVGKKLEESIVQLQQVNQNRATSFTNDIRRAFVPNVMPANAQWGILCLVPRRLGITANFATINGMGLCTDPARPRPDPQNRNIHTESILLPEWDRLLALHNSQTPNLNERTYDMFLYTFNSPCGGTSAGGCVSLIMNKVVVNTVDTTANRFQTFYIAFSQPYFYPSGINQEPGARRRFAEEHNNIRGRPPKTRGRIEMFNQIPALPQG